jgi:two-component system sensor histidine kinase KdpD
MSQFLIYKLSKAKQYLFSLVAVITISLLCFALSQYIGYQVVAFFLLITVSLIAMLFDILPVLVAAALSALIWNFFFIPPHFTFRIASTEDRILFLMYFIIALINSVLTYKIKQLEKISRGKEGKLATIKLYNTLINSLSHELRTPIATIIGASDNLQMNSQKLSPDNKGELVREISKASFRLNQQVENLLNVSRIESGFIQPKKDWCDITELIYDVVSRIEENKIAQEIHININPAIPLFKIDKGMLEQVIYNLIYNATLYTDGKTDIYITAACYTDILEIVVEDNGPGFPVDEMDKVFNKFYRLKNTKTGGTGLGLSIVKGFTEALGGRVILQNKPLGGAQFTLQIPAETSYLKNLKHE